MCDESESNTKSETEAAREEGEEAAANETTAGVVYGGPAWKRHFRSEKK